MASQQDSPEGSLDMLPGYFADAETDPGKPASDSTRSAATVIGGCGCHNHAKHLLEAQLHTLQHTINALLRDLKSHQSCCTGGLHQDANSYNVGLSLYLYPEDSSNAPPLEDNPLHSFPPTSLDPDLTPNSAIVNNNADGDEENPQDNISDLFDFDMAAAVGSPPNPLGPGAVPSLDFNAGSVAHAGSSENPSSVGGRQCSLGPIRRNYQCLQCTRSFSRPSDRNRHALAHNPHAARFSCPAFGCERVGSNGFLRKDKLTQHRTHMGH